MKPDTRYSAQSGPFHGADGTHGGTCVRIPPEGRGYIRLSRSRGIEGPDRREGQQMLPQHQLQGAGADCPIFEEPPAARRLIEPILHPQDHVGLLCSARCPLGLGGKWRIGSLLVDMPVMQSARSLYLGLYTWESLGYTRSKKYQNAPLLHPDRLKK